MSDNYPPFVVHRPDGFVGVEVSTSDQLTVGETLELAGRLMVKSAEAMVELQTRVTLRVTHICHVHNAHPRLQQDLLDGLLETFRRYVP